MKQSFLDLLTAEHRFLLTGHEYPDGDCLGAQVALYHLLRQLGKEVHICNPDPPARINDFLLEHTPIGACEPGIELPEFDVVVLLDCAELSRLGRMREAVERRGAKVAVIDHHIGSEHGCGEVSFVDSSAPATGAMVHALYLELGQPVGPAAAEGVFLSIVSDTGWFRHSNTTAEVFELAVELVRAGVDASRMYDRIYRRNDPDSIQFLAQCLTKSRLSLDGRFGSVCLDRAAVERAAKIGFDMDLVTEPLRSIDGVEVVALFKESYDGGVKVSLRATGDVDVQVIATEFGGGGHKKAAGTTIKESLRDAVPLIEARVQAALRAATKDGDGR